MSNIYQKAMNSTALVYRAIYFIKLDENQFYEIYPKQNAQEEYTSFSKTISEFIACGKIHPNCSEEVNKFFEISNIKEKLRSKNYIEYRYRRKASENGYEWCLASITAVERNGDEATAVTLTVRSIDSVVKHEEEQKKLLAREVERADAANSAKSNLLSQVSHDIRTPMNAILGMTAVAKINIDNKERVKDYLNKITISGKHLLGLVNEVLDMSKIESGRLSLSNEEFNLKDTVRSLTAFFDSDVETRKIDFDVYFHNLEHSDVIGDEQRLQQILLNILGNAFKFTPDRGRITLDISEKTSNLYGNGCYEFIVEDSGIGMEKEFIDKILEPFARAENSIAGNIEGTGLGMTIALNIARLMNGDIKAESSLNHGSKFTVTVYIKINNAMQENADSSRSKSAIDSYRNNNYTGRRVLLAEDNQFNAEVMGELLAAVGIEVDKVYNGRQAVEKITCLPPDYYDLVFMDIKMPDMNGYEAAKAIRNNGRTDLKFVPIVAMTAETFAADVKKAGKSGMNAHIAKPVELERLEEILEKFLTQSRTD